MTTLSKAKSRKRALISSSAGIMGKENPADEEAAGRSCHGPADLL